MKKKIRTSIHSGIWPVVVLLVWVVYPVRTVAQQYDLTFPKEGLITRIQKISERYSVNISFDNNLIKGVEVSVLELQQADVEQTLSQTLLSTGFTYRKFSDNTYAIIREETQIAQKQAEVAKRRSGTVTDEDGESVIGASIVIKGTSTGTVTDMDGRFVLDAPDSAVLTVSYIGFVTQEAKIDDKNDLKILLKEDNQALEEVVVIGYGSARKKDLTGATSSLDGAELAARQTTQISAALQGVLPGVTVTRSSSAPGAGGSIRVRGITSMRDNAPLVIVDGVATSSINDVHPNDIENLTVLKDAASASIYGARAASGVILITTKRGSKKDIDIDYNYSYSMDFATDMPDYADAVTYMKVVNEREWNGSGAVPEVNEYSIYDKDLIDNYWTLNQQNPDLYPNTDWVGLILKNYAPRQSHQIGITAGSERHQTKVGVGYDNVDGLFEENLSWDRVSLRVNNDITIKNWLKASIDVNMRKTSSVNPAYSPIVPDALCRPCLCRNLFGRAVGRRQRRHEPLRENAPRGDNNGQ